LIVCKNDFTHFSLVFAIFLVSSLLFEKTKFASWANTVAFIWEREFKAMSNFYVLFGLGL
jgi:hypothetical protein